MPVPDSQQLSAAGWQALRRREGVRLDYYDDSALNCTVGIGTLVHAGRCTVAERHRQVSPARVQALFAARTREAERAVHQGLHGGSLTQGQFDALVSFTYNVGTFGARHVLALAGAGRPSETARLMARFVWVHPKDKRGRRGAAVRSRGLENRRREETQPFLRQEARR